MDISSALIKSTLQEYDNQAGYTSNLRAYALGEFAGIASLRQLNQTLPHEARNLTPQETFQFITILIDAVPVGNKRHDELFAKLKKSIGEDKLNAFSRLKMKGLLKENIDRTAAHNNPQSAARMITHFNKHQKKLASAENGDKFLSDTDPYLSLKTITSSTSALSYLKNMKLDSEENKKIAQEKPIPIAKALKKLMLANIYVSQKIYSLVTNHSAPVKMASAIIALKQCGGINRELKLREDILEQAKNHIEPEDLVNGIIRLHSLDINTIENRNIIAQSNRPLCSAHLLACGKAKDMINSTGSITYGIARIFFLTKGITRDPLSSIESAEKELKEELAKPLNF